MPLAHQNVMIGPAPQPAPADAPSTDLLLLQVGDERYALVGGAVREIARWRAPTPVPGAPPALPGIISQRGAILPVVDLRALLGLPLSQPGRATRLVMAQHEGMDLALLADAVLDLIRLPTAALEPSPGAPDPRRARLVAAVGRYEDRPLGVIDLAGLIATLQEGRAP